MFPKPIELASRVTALSFIAKRDLSVWLDDVVCISQGHSGGFHCLALLKRVAVTICLHVFVKTYVFSASWEGIVGHVVTRVGLFSHLWCVKAPFPPPFSPRGRHAQRSFWLDTDFQVGSFFFPCSRCRTSSSRMCCFQCEFCGFLPLFLYSVFSFSWLLLRSFYFCFTSI